MISGQHVSKALQLEAEDLRRRHEPVPDTLTHVNATIVRSGAPGPGGGHLGCSQGEGARSCGHVLVVARF